jgi:hypothetical protein
MDNLDTAIHNTLHQSTLCAKAISSEMGIVHQVLVNKANPHTDSHKLTCREALEMQLITGNHAILTAMTNTLNIASRDTANAQPHVGVLESVLMAGKEHGDVLRTITDALSDGRFTLREQEDCQREITEAIAALTQLRESILTHGNAKAVQG